MEKEFAQYIADLEFGSQNTKSSEDRPIYQSYLADAAYILAQIVLGISKEDLFKLINSHERLRGNTWLQDPVFEKAANSYSEFKKNVGFKYK